MRQENQKPVVGFWFFGVGVKSELVKFLKDYRDELKAYTDALAQGGGN